MRASVLLFALAACAEQYHVRLDAPRPGITPDERVQMFWKLRPTAEGVVKTDGQWSNQTMFLGNKQAGVEQIEVVSPEDLEPLVGSDSETMQHARRSIVARDKARVWWLTSVAVLIGGGIAGMVLMDSDAGGGVPLDLIAFGATVVTASITYGVARRATHEELTWRKRAFTTYTRDLGLRLNVCADGTQVVACETDDTPNEPKVPATSVPGRTALLRMR